MPIAEPMNSTGYHPKLRLTLDLPAGPIVAGSSIIGSLALECRAQSGVLGLGDLSIELTGCQILRSRDHSADLVHLHRKRYFQGDSLPPSNAVLEEESSDSAFPTGFYPARKGVTIFPVRFMVPQWAPASIDFGDGIAKVHYEITAVAALFWRSERRYLVTKHEIHVIEHHGLQSYEAKQGSRIGEDGKVWVGIAVEEPLVEGRKAEVIVVVKNRSAKKTVSVGLTITRYLELPISAPSMLEITDQPLSLQFKGAEYQVESGGEGVASLVFDVPTGTCGTNGRVENEPEGLFKVSTRLGLTIGLGPVQDINVSIPIIVSDSISVPMVENRPYIPSQSPMDYPPAIVEAPAAEMQAYNVALALPVVVPTSPTHSSFADNAASLISTPLLASVQQRSSPLAFEQVLPTGRSPELFQRYPRSYNHDAFPFIGYDSLEPPIAPYAAALAYGSASPSIPHRPLPMPPLELSSPIIPHSPPVLSPRPILSPRTSFDGARPISDHVKTLEKIADEQGSLIDPREQGSLTTEESLPDKAWRSPQRAKTIPDMLSDMPAGILNKTLPSPPAPSGWTKPQPRHAQLADTFLAMGTVPTSSDPSAFIGHLEAVLETLGAPPPGSGFRQRSVVLTSGEVTPSSSRKHPVLREARLDDACVLPRLGTSDIKNETNMAIGAERSKITALPRSSSTELMREKVQEVKRLREEGKARIAAWLHGANVPSVAMTAAKVVGKPDGAVSSAQTLPMKAAVLATHRDSAAVSQRDALGVIQGSHVSAELSAPSLPCLPAQDKVIGPQVPYDVRSARGGKGGVVTATAALWASRACADGNDVLHSDTKPCPVMRPDTKRSPLVPPAGRQLKATLVPAGLSSSIARPILSSTASLARPQISSDSTAGPTVTSGVLNVDRTPYGKARLRELIGRYGE